MKRFILGGLSVVFLSAVTAPAVFADSTNLSNTGNSNYSNSRDTLQPFNLVFMAYQGYFEEQGIPSAQQLLFDYRRGEITPKDIVSSAVRANRLPASALADDSYLNAVELQMDNLLDSGRGSL